jgi:hypothetical protein
VTLVADYLFVELDGDVLTDCSGNGHHGTLVGDIARGVPGLGKRAMLFGEGVWPYYTGLSYARIQSHPDFSIGTDGMTTEAVVAPSTTVFLGSPAPLCAGYPAANYVMFAGKLGVYGGAPQAEWGLRIYPETAVGGPGCSSRAGRMSAYAFNPAGGLGSGSYHQATRTPGVYVTIRAAYDPPSAPNARVHLWFNGMKKAPSDADLYSTYGVVPQAGDADVLLGASIADRVSLQFRGAFDRFRVWRGVVAP